MSNVHIFSADGSEVPPEAKRYAIAMAGAQAAKGVICQFAEALEDGNDRIGVSLIMGVQIFNDMIRAALKQENLASVLLLLLEKMDDKEGVSTITLLAKLHEQAEKERAEREAKDEKAPEKPKKPRRKKP